MRPPTLIESGAITSKRRIYDYIEFDLRKTLESANRELL